MKVKFEGVSETLLITLYIRAKDSMSKKPIVNDKKAAEMVSKIEYDFSKLDNAKGSYYGTLARAKCMDDETKKFIARYPDAVIVSVGCGLDTRFERVDNGRIQWYNLDLSAVMEKRKEFFEENDRVFDIAESALNPQWTRKVNAKGKKVLITCEGVTTYFSEAEVKQLLEVLTDGFEDFEAHIDLSHKALVKRAKKHDAVKHMKNAEFKFGVVDGSELVKLNPKLTQIGLINFTDEMKKHVP